MVVGRPFVAALRWLSPTSPSCPLLRSILANKEPFKGGDWRKTPYIPRCACAWLGAAGSRAVHLPVVAQPASSWKTSKPSKPIGEHSRRCADALSPACSCLVPAPLCRPYVRLTDYDIVEPEMGEVIKRKLTTKVRRGEGCGGR